MTSTAKQGVLVTVIILLSALTGCCEGNKVTITAHPANTTKCTGEITVFQCHFEGNLSDIPSHWKKFIAQRGVYEHLVTESRYKEFRSFSLENTTHYGALKIENITTDDEGWYVLKVGSDMLSNRAYLNVITTADIVPVIIEVTSINSSMFTVYWTSSVVNDNYTVIWINLRTGVMYNGTVLGNTNSYTVTGLSGDVNYNVSIAAVNRCGMMATSDSVTVYAITISFNQSTYSVDEDAGTVQLVLVLSNPSSTDFIVQVSDTQNTATRGVDYGFGPYIATFFAGETIASFSILINDDSIFETNETFSLTIDPNSLPTYVTGGSHGIATVTIMDDDTKITTQPQDVTVCAGEVAVFTCVVDRNGTNITSDDVMWQQIRMGGQISTLSASLRGVPFNIATTISGDILTSTLTVTGVTDSNLLGTSLYHCVVNDMMSRDASLHVSSGPPGMPMNIRFSDITNTSFVVQWDEVDDADRYIVNWRDDGGSVRESTTSLTSITITRLTPNTTYVVYVGVINACGSGQNSSIKSVMTKMSGYLLLPSSVSTSLSVLTTPLTMFSTMATMPMATVDSSSLSTGVAVAVTFTITFIITLTVSVVITFLITFVIVKRKFEKIYKTTHQPTQQMPLYETVITPAITKSDVKLEANPAYGTSDRVTMNDNPAYQSCK